MNSVVRPYVIHQWINVINGVESDVVSLHLTQHHVEEPGVLRVRLVSNDHQSLWIGKGRLLV